MLNILKPIKNYFKRKVEKRNLIQKHKGELKARIEADIATYNLICDKKSGLSRSQRELVIAKIDAYIALGYIKVENHE